MRANFCPVAAPWRQWRKSMIDAAYILGTVLFFVLMRVYTRACERLGAGKSEQEESR